MRVRVLQDFSTLNEVFHAGEVREIDPGTAGAWLKDGLAMQDKSLDGAKETKAKPEEKPKPSKTKKTTG